MKTALKYAGTLYTVKDFVENVDWLTEGSLRWLIFNRETNGFNKCIRRMGNRILISAPDFEEWIESQKD